jgi:hypothetical protein
MWLFLIRTWALHALGSSTNRILIFNSRPVALMPFSELAESGTTLMVELFMGHLLARPMPNLDGVARPLPIKRSDKALNIIPRRSQASRIFLCIVPRGVISAHSRTIGAFRVFILLPIVH